MEIAHRPPNRPANGFEDRRWAYESPRKGPKRIERPEREGASEGQGFSKKTYASGELLTKDASKRVSTVIVMYC